MSMAQQSPASSDDGLKKLSDVSLEMPEYYWHDRFPVNTMTVIGGKSGKGKSMLTCKIAADVSRGHGMKKASAVIVSAVEDGESVTRARIQGAGGDIDQVHIVGTPYRIPEDIARLERDIIRLQAKVVILDTANKHISAPIRNDQKVSQALTPLQKMCERHKVSVIFVTHTLKHVSRNIDPMDAIGGATGGLVGSARCVALFGVHPDNEDARAIAWVKDSYRKSPEGMTFTIENVDVYDEQGRIAAVTGALDTDELEANVDAIALVAGKKKEDGERAGNAEKKAEAAEWLTDKLKDGPLPAQDVAEEAVLGGISKATLRRAREEIGVEVPRDGFGKGSVVFWRLPFGHPTLNPAANNKTPGGK